MTCQHAEADRETVLLPNDEAEHQPIIMAGVRYCTRCYTLIIHLGEDVERVDTALDDLTETEFCDRCDGVEGVELEPIDSTYSKLCASCRHNEGA